MAGHGRLEGHTTGRDTHDGESSLYTKTPINNTGIYTANRLSNIHHHLHYTNGKHEDKDKDRWLVFVDGWGVPVGWMGR